MYRNKKRNYPIKDIGDNMFNKILWIIVLICALYGFQFVIAYDMAHHAKDMIKAYQDRTESVLEALNTNR